MSLRKILIAGAVAAFALPALAEAHEAKRTEANLMTVVRADGSVAQVRNPNPVAPRGAGAVIAPSPFAMMNQMAAQMDRQMALMMAQSRAPQTRSAQTSSAQQVSAGAAPSGVCMQSVEVRQVAGQQARVVRRSSGNCGAPNASTQAAPQQRAPAQRPAPVAPTQRGIPADSI